MRRPGHDGERATETAAHILKQCDRPRPQDDRVGRRREVDDRAVEIEKESVAARVERWRGDVLHHSAFTALRSFR